jgi:hypothetical protein
MSQCTPDKTKIIVIWILILIIKKIKINPKKTKEIQKILLLNPKIVYKNIVNEFYYVVPVKWSTII